ncbi:Ribosomal RNA small subunit methyltransferase C [hydrothermal vent metagenome]|uniref:Ribosomal RNA small subunit methyltransferase C n=1 Tax=hydrothermal vent metagenome TaxID=652676 RepID=A0A3B1A8R9_9ZZZZ
MKDKNKTELDKLRNDIVFSDVLCAQPLTFHTTWGIFSPREIDEGSRLLLNYIEVEQDSDCLDLGCGYGVIGLTLAMLANNGTTTLVDKDFVAIEYAQKNAELNKIQNVDILLSNGLEQVNTKKFDVVASNIPAKVGNELMTLFFNDAYQQLNPGGKVYVVTINGLRNYIKRTFTEIFGNYKKLKQGKSYTVSMASKSE